MKQPFFSQTKGPILLLSLLLFAFSTPAISGSWKLDTGTSSINFYSIKKGSIGETHRFTDFRGQISGNTATVSIKPDSVDSKVGIRDDRMREFLFETKLFPTIEISAKLGSELSSLSSTPTIIKLPAQLSLHGVTKTIDLNVLVTKGNGQVTVSSSEPVIIKASDYGMSAGIIKLSELVGSIDIASAVPVYFNLVFLD